MNSEDARVLDQRETAAEAQASIISVLRRGNGKTSYVPDVIAAIERRHPELSRETVKSAIISLVNRGVLELTLDGHLRYRPAR